MVDLTAQYDDLINLIEMKGLKYPTIIVNALSKIRALSASILRRVDVWDASTGVVPSATPSENDYWVISVAGTIAGIPYEIGDWIVYTTVEGWSKVSNQGVGGGMVYRGTLDASVEVTYPAAPFKGDYYIITGAGNLDLDAYNIGDWCVYNGTTWDYIDNSTIDIILDDAYGIGWDTDTTHTASRNAIFDQIQLVIAGAASNAFATITGIVNDVVADGIADTLTFAAVGGLTIVGTAATDTITFTNTITQYTDAMADARIVVQNTDPAGTIDIAIDALIATHTAVAAAHHAKYTDAEVDARIVVQNTNPAGTIDIAIDALIATHTAIAAAHHAKYTDAEVDARIVVQNTDPAGTIDIAIDALIATHTAIAAAHHTATLAFKTITGITADVVADSVTDTLTLAAVGGLTIVGTAATDTITFTNTITQYTDLLAVAAVNAAGLSLASTKVITSANEDLTFNFGRSVLHNTIANWAMFSHRAGTIASEYIGISNDGAINLSAAAGQIIQIVIDSVAEYAFNASEFYIGYNRVKIKSGLSSGQSSGISVEATVDTNAFGFGAALYINPLDGNYDECDADDAAKMPCTALALGTTGTIDVLLFGYICDSSWAFTVGQPVYVDTDLGDLTTTAPSGSGDQVQRVGIAVGTTTLLFNPSMDVSEVL